MVSLRIVAVVIECTTDPFAAAGGVVVNHGAGVA